MNEQQPFNDELISAFLDGETTSEEQARVEERLMDSVDDRHLFEDLKALGQRMQSLPQEKLGKDLTSKILRRAERRMLEVEAETPAEKEVPEPETEPPVDDPPVEKRVAEEDRGQWRGMIWAGAALAVVLLLFINRDPGNGANEAKDTVARQSDVDEPADQTKKASAPVDREIRESTLVDTKMPTERFSGMKETSRDVDESGADWQSDATAPSRSPGATSGLGDSVVDNEAIPEDDAGADLFDGEKVADATPKALPSNDGGIIGDFDRTHGCDLESSSGGAWSMANRADDWKRKSTSSADSREYALDRLASLAGDRMLVVNLDVMPLAQKEQSFDRSLAKHRILVESFAKQSASASHAASGRDTVVAKSDSGELAVTRRLGKASGEVELVYVEAPADRVAAVLDELALRPNQFQLVSMDDGSRVQRAAGPMLLKEEAIHFEFEKKAEAAPTKSEYEGNVDQEQQAESAADAFEELARPAREKGGAFGAPHPPAADLPIEAPVDSAGGGPEMPDIAQDPRDEALPAEDPSAEELSTADEATEEEPADKPMTEPATPMEPVAPATPAAEAPEESAVRPDDVPPPDAPVDAPAATAPSEDADAVEEAEIGSATSRPATETPPQANGPERRADNEDAFDQGDDDFDGVGASADDAEPVGGGMPERDAAGKDEEAERDPARQNGPRSIRPAGSGGVGGGGADASRDHTERGRGGPATDGVAAPDSVNHLANAVESDEKRNDHNGKRDDHAAKKRTESKYEGIARKLRVPTLVDEQKHPHGGAGGIRLESSLMDALRAEGEVEDAPKPKSAASDIETRPQGSSDDLGEKQIARDDAPAKMVRVLFVLRSVPADANVVGAEAATPPATALETDASIRSRAAGDTSDGGVISGDHAPVKE
jgi:hypothetical protein